jgi:GTP-binding protein YchF
VVDVPDARVEALARIEGSRKIVHAKVRFVDVPGGLTAQGIAEYRQTDALCLVVRGFGGSDPAADLEALNAELLLADLASVDASLDKARKRARGQAEARAEVEVLERVHGLLDAEQPARAGDFDDAALKLLKGYGLLTMKPWIAVVNTAEDGTPQSIPESIPEGAIEVGAALEAEVAGMERDEAAALLAGYGIEKPGLDRVIEGCYRALDLITFLTTGSDESRAWEVRRGAKAPEAAGVIHSDLERGFIRAEVIEWDRLVEARSEAEAKRRGWVRVEGRDYLVKDGDVLNIRFNV